MRPGELHWFRGSLHVCRGSSLWFSSFDLVAFILCLSFVLSRMCRAVTLAWGVRDLSSSSDLSLCLSFGFRSLVEVYFSRFFSFPFLFGYQNVCVVNALIKREIESLCDSRTGGGSLPGVMSDWQRGVDWFLAKYCRCRLRLDWCWCGWRTSAKGRCRWGLQVWRRQVGLVWGTRWPTESSAGRMVARMTRWSHGQFLGWASKPRSSRDYVGAESWVEIGGGYTEFVGFPVQKTIGFLGWSTKPRPKTEVQQHRTGLTGGSDR
jgi:hypothetical protein